MALQRRHQRMSDFMVGYYQPFLVRKYLVLLLVSCNYHLDTLLQIGLYYILPSFPDSPEGRLVYHVGKLRARRAGGCPCNGVEINIVSQLYLSGVYF